MECVGQDNKISGLFPAKRVEEGINISVVFVFSSRVSLWSYQDASFTSIMNIVIMEDVKVEGSLEFFNLILLPPQI